MEFDQAILINSTALKNISSVCESCSIKLIHISTDYIFDGEENTPYRENYTPNPINNYGKSKLFGEINILNSTLQNYIIIRTSWLYSDHGNNFLKKIIEKIKRKELIKVTDNEKSSPTNAYDLADTILKIIPKFNHQNKGVYNYSNNGICSRYDFAFYIAKYFKSENLIIKSDFYKNDIRPKFSALDSSKLMMKFDIQIVNWQESLKNFLSEKYKTS